MKKSEFDKVEKEEIEKVGENIQDLSIDETTSSSFSKKESAGLIRNILLMGRTGNGKSTLGNVLINKDGNFGEVFEESASSVSVTKGISVQELETDSGIKYRIIDTVGLGDTSLTAQAVLYLLAKIATDEDVKEHGINQVLFVAKGRLTKEEISAYKLLRSIIFDSEVDKFTTIVRTGFEDFEDEVTCENDRNLLWNDKNEELANFAKQVKRIIYLDNPPSNIKGSSKRIQEKNESNRRTREESRTRLLTYLATCQGTYNSGNLNEINERVSGYMTEEEKIQKQMESLEADRQKQKAELEQTLANLQTKQDEELAKVRQELAHDKEKLAHEEARIRRENAVDRERWEREQDRLDKISEAQLSQMQLEMENKRKLIALEVERSDREKANIFSRTWHSIFGW